MLGRLIQTAASYGRGNNALESATEESHTRNLLYGQSYHIYSLSQSPPTSPYNTPSFRPGSFDDRGGLELEEKDVRILIAQDAAGAEEKPTLLFDSRPVVAANASLPSHVRHASMTGTRTSLPNEWKQQGQHAVNVPADGPFRSRRTTMTGPASPWSRSVREIGTREEAFLECMFGVTSSTKTASTTKIHILPGKPKASAKVDTQMRTVADASDAPPRRAPLHRSRTSTAIVKSPQIPSSTGADPDIQSQDSVLITRLFGISLSETVAPTPRPASGPISAATNSVIEGPGAQSLSDAQSQFLKKPKLVERKVPAFAIGLILNLPRQTDSHAISLPQRPLSRSAHGHALSSASSSYGSDMQSSWSFLNAIPETLVAANSSLEEPDRCIETIVNNEDVILRAIALLETESAKIIREQLQKVLDQVVGPGPKTPKEKSMQRINQRIISISDAAAIAKAHPLQHAARQVIRRVIYALRIPRVIVGLGFSGGHWSDEARIAYRACGRRQQDFFFFTLLTAFLGQHTQWLQRLAPEWYRRQHRLCFKQQSAQHALSQRTIIISDQRAMARRLIFLLASFLPGSHGLDGLQKPGEDLPGSYFSVSSPSSHMMRQESLRRAAGRRMHEQSLHPHNNDRTLLSTSVDSTDSVHTAEPSRRLMARKDSDAWSIKGSSLLSMSEEHATKMGALTTSALTSHPTTPVAFFSTKAGIDQDGYFPPSTANSESIATAGLASILRRDSSSFGNTSNVSSRLSSFMSGISDIWSQKPPNSSGSVANTAYSSMRGSLEQQRTDSNPRRNKSNTLQEMVKQVETPSSGVAKSPELRFANNDFAVPEELSSPAKRIASAPRLRVDDKDGVVDVDLDLPGFTQLDVHDLFKSPSRSNTRSTSASGRNIAESIRSLRSIPASLNITHPQMETNVAGYLKRHHEDFSLQAIRPYSELEDDVKRSMLAEPSPSIAHDDFPSKLDDPWTPICSTVIADMRTFSVRRLTLKRKLNTAQDLQDHKTVSGSHVVGNSKRSHSNGLQQTFMDEEIKDFDTALADAIEKVLDISDAVQGTPVSPRFNHSRTTSTSTMKSTPPTMSALGASSYATVSREYVKQDCRQVVLGALENIVLEVCETLNKLEKGRDIHGGRSFHAASVKEDVKQENVLREGVKCWLLDVERPKVY